MGSPRKGTTEHQPTGGLLLTLGKMEVIGVVAVTPYVFEGKGG